MAVGSKVMIRRNIDVSKGIVNGSMGIVDSFVYEPNHSVAEIYVTLLDKPDMDPVRITRKSTEYLVSSLIDSCVFL